jgi:hypothetical protein
MSLADLVNQVKANSAAKRDYVSNTAGAVRLVLAKDAETFPGGVAFVLLKDGSTELERFALSPHAHDQIAGHLGIPTRYYDRLLADHPDLVLSQVNALFEREPSTRLIRTIHGHVRAFLSDKYQRLDNDLILAKSLPVLMADGQAWTNELLSANVTDERLDIKCVFTDPALEFSVGNDPTGKPEVIRPGFHLTNSEVGKGKLRTRGFFYRAYCRNGAVYGSEDMVSFERTHVGGRLIEGTNFEVLSDETKKLDDAAIVSGCTDVMRALASRQFVQQMADQLRALKTGVQVERPVEAMPGFAKELGLNEKESADVLTALIRDRDLSRWGMLNAVTEQANQAETYERATELEGLADNLLRMPVARWNTLAKVAA